VTVPAGSPEHLRLFIAVSIPDSVRDKIAAAQNELRAAVPHDVVRWTRMEQFHLTLRFLGAVETVRFPALVEEVRLACKNFAPLRLRAGGIGFFPNQRVPRVVWVGIEDPQGRLPLLHRAVQLATKPFTTEESEETLTGHVTLGRVKRIQRREAQLLASAAARLARADFGEWTADHIAIMRSEVSSQGAKHTCLETIPLDFSGV
jgi:2'-5' RNA ligase